MALLVRVTLTRGAHIGPRSSCAARASPRRPTNVHCGPRPLCRVCCSGQGPHTGCRAIFDFFLRSFQCRECCSGKEKKQKKSSDSVGIGSQSLSFGYSVTSCAFGTSFLMLACSVPSHACLAGISRFACHQKTGGQELLRSRVSAIPGLLAHYVRGWAGLMCAYAGRPTLVGPGLRIPRGAPAITYCAHNTRIYVHTRKRLPNSHLLAYTHELPK